MSHLEIKALGRHPAQSTPDSTSVERPAKARTSITSSGLTIELDHTTKRTRSFFPRLMRQIAAPIRSTWHRIIRYFHDAEAAAPVRRMSDAELPAAPTRRISDAVQHRIALFCEGGAKAIRNTVPHLKHTAAISGLSLSTLANDMASNYATDFNAAIHAQRQKRDFLYTSHALYAAHDAISLRSTMHESFFDSLSPSLQTDEFKDRIEKHIVSTTGIKRPEYFV
jgi:hypothetical protein